MRRHLRTRYPLLLTFLVLTISLYACGSDTIQTSTQETENITESNNPPEAGKTEDHIKNEAEQDLDPKEQLPEKEKDSETSLNVRKTILDLGDSLESVLKKLGKPGRIVETEYDFKYYIFNNDYKRLLFVAIKDNQVVGYYTDSLDFNYQGIQSGSSLGDVNSFLHTDYALEEVIEHTAKKYKLWVLMDKLETGKVTGIYLLSKDVKIDKYTKAANRAIELIAFDLTNSIRKRNQLPVLSWSSSAAIAARKHSADMAENNFFDHKNPKRETPGMRLKSEGIFYTTCGENIISGYGTSIFSCHAWFNSKGHRKNMLNPNFRSLGVGFVYDKKSTSKTYMTQNFFR